jgi:hypothetical protein
MLKQKRNSLVHRLGVKELIVVQHKDHLAGSSFKVVDQASQDCLRRRRLHPLQELSGLTANLLIDGLQRGNQVTQETP